jgi:hypothetical protein
MALLLAVVIAIQRDAFAEWTPRLSIKKGLYPLLPYFVEHVDEKEMHVEPRWQFDFRGHHWQSRVLSGNPLVFKGSRNQ